MATMYTVVLQAASTNGNDHMVHLRRASSASSTGDLKPDGRNDQMAPSRTRSSMPQAGKVQAPSLKGLVTEYFGPGQRLREIYLASREGERFAVPITLAVQLSSQLREFIDSLMVESATRGRSELSDKARHTIDVPCSTDVLKTLVDFVTAKLELDLKLSEEGKRMTEDEKKEHWREYIYSRVSWRMDLDDFADDILQDQGAHPPIICDLVHSLLSPENANPRAPDQYSAMLAQVAEYLSIKSLYDLMKCCFRLRLL